MRALAYFLGIIVAIPAALITAVWGLEYYDYLDRSPAKALDSASCDFHRYAKNFGLPGVQFSQPVLTSKTTTTYEFIWYLKSNHSVYFSDTISYLPRDNIYYMMDPKNRWVTNVSPVRMPYRSGECG
ncbi:MAG: hypothetical protein ABI963_05245 [Rhizomicrobium sp.]